jgi:hypothetical protein
MESIAWNAADLIPRRKLFKFFREELVYQCELKGASKGTQDVVPGTFSIS